MPVEFALTFTDAPSPFDDPDADLIIRSSDRVQFRVYKSFLSLASPVFKAMFSLPQPPDAANDETVDGHPVVQFTETSATIHNLLILCYPAYLFGNNPSPAAESLSDVGNLLEAVTKYDMHKTRDTVCRFLLQPQFLEKEPLRAYVIACRQRNEAMARTAARHAIRHELLGEDFFSELEMVDAGLLYQVLLYHKRCILAAMKVAGDHTWIREGHFGFLVCPKLIGGGAGMGHTIQGKSKEFRVPAIRVHGWWSKFMELEDTKVALERSVSEETIKDAGRVNEACAKLPISAFGAALLPFVIWKRSWMNLRRRWIGAYLRYVPSRLVQVA
jgi:hypothetical protein